jgi:hypothetical protein
MNNGLSNPDQLTFSWAERHASPSALPDSAPACPTLGADSCLPILKSLGVFGLDTVSGKTFQESCHREVDGILVPSSGRWGNWGMGGPTGSWTLNGAEHTGIPAPSRSAGDVSSLSDVLETGPVLPRFSLSAKACSGILRRAERRGKALPPMLKVALEQSAASGQREQADPQATSATT